MKTKSLHWMDNPDPDVVIAGKRSYHTNYPRMSSETIINLLQLKAHLEGRRLDILAEAQAFEERNLYL